MALICRNLLGLVSFNYLELVAGRDGLDKMVTWPYVKQTQNLKGWINGGEILFVAEENAEYNSDYFCNIINECNELMVSAVVFLCGGKSYADSIPQEARKLADKYAIPLFQMPSDVRIIDVTREISNTIFQWNYQNKQSGHFLDDLIHEDYLNGVQREQSGAFYGFDIDKSYFIAVICDKAVINSYEDKDVVVLANRLSVLALKFSAECDKMGEKFVNTVSCGTMICYMTVADSDKRKQMMKAYSKIIEEYNNINSCHMTAGFSRIFTGLEKMPTAYNEARQALIFSMKNKSGNKSCAYEDMGILRFLLAGKDKEQLLSYCDELLADLRKVDETEKTDYVRTLWMYLKMNNNLVKTSQLMYIHRNTLVNRINKIQSIVGKDFNEVDVKMQYLNAFAILEFYGMIE